MDDLDLSAAIKKTIRERREAINGILMDGMLKDIEHYKSLQGQLEVLNLVEMSISDFYKENKF
ncbi:MAG TPA: hypothetical protein DCL66_01700 [Gammaproteobacteria bacterium]|jgi:hypothetical protein|nr:hypothetical protein [Gammaproteobacteria bacterium]|tara:strand:- start:1224 stop:1412 length:189 start_codon:yes stop_codon:yes gene_type:complete